MKKKILNVLLLAAVITTMMFSVTACGSKTNDAQNTAADADGKKDDASDGQMSLQEWTESDECIQFLEMMNEGMADQGVSIFFEVDGDVIALVYKYDEQIEVADNAEEAIGQLFDSNATLFESVRDELIDETGNQNTVLRIEYRNADDSVIYSQDF